MRKFLALAIMAGLCIAIPASAEYDPIIVTKQAKWQTWGPVGPAGVSRDTTLLDGAGVDTTAAIYIGDMNLSAGGLTTGPGATTAMNGIKVFITGDGVADDVDSLYYRIEQSPDGNHWTAATAAQDQNIVQGVIAGFDQGNATAGTTVNNCLTFFIKLDQDVVDGGSTTAATFNTSWAWAPFIRIHIRTLASDVFKAARLFVSYPGYREVH